MCTCWPDRGGVDRAAWVAALLHVVGGRICCRHLHPPTFIMSLSSTATQHTSPAAHICRLPSLAHVSADGRTNHLQTSLDAGGRQRPQTQDSANNVHDLGAVLVICFQAELVWSLRQRLVVAKPAPETVLLQNTSWKAVTDEASSKSVVTCYRGQTQTRGQDRALQ